MDSVHFFKPRQFRTAVYHEILIGYLDYTKLLGYMSAASAQFPFARDCAIVSSAETKLLDSRHHHIIIIM